MSSSEFRMKKLLTIVPLLGLNDKWEKRLQILTIPGLFVWGVWMGWWAVYGALHRHRGFSHTPVLGTLVRVLWLSPIGYLLYVYGVQIPLIYPVAALVGLMISDWGHYMRDYHEWEI